MVIQDDTGQGTLLNDVHVLACISLFIKKCIQNH